MSKHPNRKSIGKNDIVRALKSLINHTRLISERMDETDRILGSYIGYKKDWDAFSEFLDGKHKQSTDEPSGTGSESSEE